MYRHMNVSVSTLDTAVLVLAHSTPLTSESLDSVPSSTVIRVSSSHDSINEAITVTKKYTVDHNFIKSVQITNYYSEN